MYRKGKRKEARKKAEQEAEKMVHFLRYFWGQLTMFSGLF